MPAERASVSAISLRHAHFGLPWVRPCDNRGKCHMNEKSIQCSNVSQRVRIYLQLFPVIQPVSSKVRHFSTFCTFWPHLVTLWDNRGKCYMEGKRIQCWSNASQHVHIYLQPFTSYRDIGRKLQLFPTPLHITAPLGCFHWNSGEKFGPQKTRIMGLPGSEDSLTIS